MALQNLFRWYRVLFFIFLTQGETLVPANVCNNPILGLHLDMSQPPSSLVPIGSTSDRKAYPSLRTEGSTVGGWSRGGRGAMNPHPCHSSRKPGALPQIHGRPKPGTAFLMRDAEWKSSEAGLEFRVTERAQRSLIAPANFYARRRPFLTVRGRPEPSAMVPPSAETSDVTLKPLNELFLAIVKFARSI